MSDEFKYKVTVIYKDGPREYLFHFVKAALETFLLLRDDESRFPVMMEFIR